MHDIAFSDAAFDSLVLPKNQKELILGFTATQQSYRSQFDDVIEGKGRGIILLLWYVFNLNCFVSKALTILLAVLLVLAKHSPQNLLPKR